MAQLVRNSEVWRGRYSRNVRDLQHSPIWKVAIRGLNAALHRLYCWQKPFSLVVFTLDAGHNSSTMSAAMLHLDATTGASSNWWVRKRR